MSLFSRQYVSIELGSMYGADEPYQSEGRIGC